MSKSGHDYAPIRRFDCDVNCTELKKAARILRHAHETAAALRKGFTAMKEARVGAKVPGPPTDDEQDVLRSMLVLAGAGLDAVTKQLVRDALPKVVAVEPKARGKLTTFAERQLKAAEESVRRGRAAPTAEKLLASVLASANPQAQLIEHYVTDLTANSLQSHEELRKVAAAVGVEMSEICDDEEVLKEAFKARNEIVHGFDMDFDHPTRNRTARQLRTLVQQTNAVLAAAEQLVRQVDAKLNA